MAVSHDSTGEVCVVRGCAKYTEERPPCNSPNDIVLMRESFYGSS